MANNKVQLSNGTVLIDLTDTTAVASDVASGKYFYTAAGVRTEGTATGGGGSITIEDIPNATGTTLQITTDGSGGGGGVSATEHTIHLEFSDSTDTDIPVYYDDALIGTMITAYTPATYGNKTVTLAELDGVTWYEVPSGIPLNTELIDSTKLTTGMSIDSSGNAVADSNNYRCTDYTPVASGMTFSYVCARWDYIGLYDGSKAVVGVVYPDSDGTPISGAEYFVEGTLSGAELPSNVAYARLCSTSTYYLSLIRTA